MSSYKRPVDEAKEFYGGNFESMVDEFLVPQRYIYSGDDFFVLAYPYVSNTLCEEEDVSLFRLNLNKDLDKIDTWVIHYFAGNISRLFAIAPFDLDYVAFQRKDGKWKLYNTQDLKRKLGV